MRRDESRLYNARDGMQRKRDALIERLYNAGDGMPGKKRRAARRRGAAAVPVFYGVGFAKSPGLYVQLIVHMVCPISLKPVTE